MKPAVLYVFLAAVLGAAQQPAASTPNRAIGEVTAVDAAARQIALKPDAGPVLTVTLADNTLFLRVPPGEKDLKKAARIALADIGAGDRVYARGRLTEDGKLAATAVIVMTRADLARKHEADRAEWQRRGTAGAITALDPAAKEITIAVGPRDAAHTAVIAAANAQLRRYAPDSIRFADAQPSSFDQVAVGDHLRVLGDKNADGSRIQAEEVVFGSFRNLAALVKSVDASSGEIRATDLETKKPVLIRISPDSLLRRMPPMMAQTIAQRRAHPGGSASPWPHSPAEAAGPPRGQGAAANARGGRPDFQQMLERMPALTLAELKPGDAVILSATRGSQPSQVTAIALLAGVEPLLASGAPDPQLGGMWNFEIGMP
jgi:Cu/Ag efflux protein CusF